MRLDIRASRVEHVVLNDLLSHQVEELVSRLSSSQFQVRSSHSNRRPDGSISVHHATPAEGMVLQVRLNAYGLGKSAVLRLHYSPSRTEARELMVRESKMGGDSRELIAVPQKPTARDLPLIENLIFGACKCVARGSVIADTNEVGKQYSLFLPSLDPLPFFNREFEAVGLGSLY